MQQFEVLFDGHVAGIVEALDSTRALEVAYKVPEYAARLAARQAISIRRDGSYGMYILIDTTNNQAIARHDSPKALAALALIQFANIDTMILASGQNKNFSMLDAQQLDGLARSVGLTLDPKTPYNERLKATRAALESCEILQLPFPAGQLEAQAYGLDPRLDKPMAFNPDGMDAKPLAKWSFEPQRNRARQDSPHWSKFAAGLGYGPGVTTPETVAHLMGEEAPARKAPPSPAGARRSATAQGPATPAAPKPPRAPSAPATRPAAGTKTGLVWDIADRVRKENPEMVVKDLRKKITEQCEAEGLAGGTINVQYGKWKSSNGL